MKIIIDLDEVINYGLSPAYVYHSLYMEYWNKLKEVHHNNLWGLTNACDTVARLLYAQNTGRSCNVKNLILTYADAEACFELFRQFADVWAGNAQSKR